MSELLRVEGLKVHFPVNSGAFRRSPGSVKAVDNISFAIPNGKVVALVGESGCGKTTVARTILGLNHISDGRITLNGKDVTEHGKGRTPEFRSRVQMVFQDPYESLNPRRTVLQSLAVPLRANAVVPKTEYQAECIRLLDMVGLSPGAAFLNRYPHQFSGGQRQRIGIARAIAVRPDLIVADEAVSALDISIRAQVLTLMRRLQQDLGLAYLFISHDLGVVRSLADHVLVMYLGRVVEEASTQDLFERPTHPYTQSLLAASPIPDPVAARARKRIPLTGEVPSPINPPKGCHFHPRCPLAIDRCRNETPALRLVGAFKTACHRAEEMPELTAT
ncbi:ABC transporter ATP-binding protein [Oceaniovalibus sp. ACAM 378]|uniref:ABC transporter ATP-binding protein n=1 Tax=Oceaniovalibus sp. ACAM 378 TaxID=2599923 RepID=UPI0011D6E319|nr:oligopeptide/dipeptide ABC transporter ATP-binding protein [Oceaniovalibus sp. ACAM 378]TYB84327.1 ATP-binding cassette domain-containing protein [Oceaniovalibus sp. ACAM 378]